MTSFIPSFPGVDLDVLPHGFFSSEHTPKIQKDVKHKGTYTASLSADPHLIVGANLEDR